MSAASITSNMRQVASQLALDANARLGFMVQNVSDATVYLSYAELSSASNHSVAIASSAYFEGPYFYTGPVAIAWTFAGTGHTLVTEVLP